MKPTVVIIVFIIVIDSFAVAKSFDFGNFFFGEGKRSVSTGPTSTPTTVPPTPTQAELNLTGAPPSASAKSDGNRSDPDWLTAAEVSNATEFVNASARNEATAPSASAESEESASNSTSATVNSTSPGDVTASTAEVEEVVLGAFVTHADIIAVNKTIFQKSLDWVQDAYTLSILVPVAAGILFATAIIMTVACCRWVRRCCRRRRFRKKVLPDSVKNLRPSDQARLLAEVSSDEEY